VPLSYLAALAKRELPQYTHTRTNTHTHTHRHKLTPVPLSYLAALAKRELPHPAHVKVPSRFSLFNALHKGEWRGRERGRGREIRLEKKGVTVQAVDHVHYHDWDIYRVQTNQETMELVQGKGRAAMGRRNAIRFKRVWRTFFSSPLPVPSLEPPIPIQLSEHEHMKLRSAAVTPCMSVWGCILQLFTLCTSIWGGILQLFTPCMSVWGCILQLLTLCTGMWGGVLQLFTLRTWECVCVRVCVCV